MRLGLSQKSSMSNKENINWNKMNASRNGDEEFIAPEGYFQQLESELNLRIQGQDEFAVPDAYFENLHSTWSIGRDNKRTRRRKLMGMVAAIIVLLGSVWLREMVVEEECVTYACLLEKTEITQEDIEFYDEYMSTDWYSEE